MKKRKIARRKHGWQNRVRGGYKLNIRFEAISVVCDIGKQFETILNYIYSSNIKCLDINALNI